jgi:hypothetical protein
MTTANTPAPKEVAALLVIAGKILSGRTEDKNIGYIAEYLTAHLAGDDLLDRIELRRASLFEIAEFEDAGAK